MQFKTGLQISAKFTSQLGWVWENRRWVATALLPGDNSLQQSVHPPRPHPPGFFVFSQAVKPCSQTFEEGTAGRSFFSFLQFIVFIQKYMETKDFCVGGRATLSRMKLWSENGITETPWKMQLWLRLYTEGLGESTALYFRSRKYKIPNINLKLKIFHLMIHSCCINFFPSVLWALSLCTPSAAIHFAAKSETWDVTH